MKSEKDKTIIVPTKTVIFSHSGAVFNLDEEIRGNSFAIENPPEDDVEETLKFYKKEIRRAALTGRQFILTKYTPLLAETFEDLLLDFSSPGYKDWTFMTFFHDNKEIDAEEETKISLENRKRFDLPIMMLYGFILKYTIPYGYTITGEDLKAIDDFWEAPRYAKTIDDLANRKPHFPIHSYPVGGASALRRIKRIKELLA